ncbi:MAG: hypothetical protein H0W13_01115 [Nitrospirales bacterium]|nr:hypothetical protein [Nitrospirales bacterium]
MSVGLLVGFVMACQVGCVGREAPPSRIASHSPAPIRTQAAQFAPPAPPVVPDTTKTYRSVTALTVAPQDVPPSSDLERWVQSLMQRGITMVLIDIGTSAGSNPIVFEDGRRATGIYFRSQWADTIRDIFGELLPLAHQQGLSVFGAVSPRRINWVDPTLGWQDHSYDAVHRQLRLSPYLDLFHPGFQEYLVGLLTDLADTGVDGILFRNDVSLGPYDGFSPFGVRGFERDFHTRTDPAQFFTGIIPAPQAPALGHGPAQPFPAEYWRWAGWKARERVKILERLGHAMRLHGNTRHVALEIHPEAVTDPRVALVKYGEDLLEAKRRFQYFLLRSASQSSSPGHQTSVIIDQMKGLLGSAERIWTTIPVSSDDAEQIGISSRTDREQLGMDIGLIYQKN